VPTYPSPASATHLVEDVLDGSEGWGGDESVTAEDGVVMPATRTVEAHVSPIVRAILRAARARTGAPHL